MKYRLLLATGVPVAALLLVACGSSTSTSTAPTTAPAPTPAAPTTATTAAPTTAAPTTATTALRRAPAGSVPAVANATDLGTEPTVAASSGTAPNVLVVKDLVLGTGAVPKASDTVKVQYVGALYTTGKIFDASWTDSGPASFPISEVVPGFGDAILGMHVGGRREVVIPPALGYGTAGDPPTIPGNATLVFVIDLLAV